MSWMLLACLCDLSNIAATAGLRKKDNMEMTFLIDEKLEPNFYPSKDYSCRTFIF